jgi:hypothetical protein
MKSPALAIIAVLALSWSAWSDSGVVFSAADYPRERRLTRLEVKKVSECMEPYRARFQGRKVATAILAGGCINELKRHGEILCISDLCPGDPHVLVQWFLDEIDKLDE